MRKVCKVCNEVYTVKFFGRDVESWLIPVCSLDCLVQWIQELPKNCQEVSDKILNLQFRPFQSLLEERIFKELSKHFDILYEPFIFQQGRQVYIPDFYLVDKNIFIEVKGGRDRITKFKRFARLYPLYLLIPTQKMLEVEDV